MVGSKCLQPGDATTPPPWAKLQRYAASQAVPSLANGVGQLQADHTGDILGISCLTIPRFGTDVAVDGMLSSQSMTELQQRWGAAQLLRRGKLRLASGSLLQLNSSVHMGFRNSSVLLELDIALAAPSTAPTIVNVSISLQALVARNLQPGAWGWPVPRPRPAGFVCTDQPGPAGAPGTVVTADSASSARSVAAFALTQPSSLTPTADNQGRIATYTGLILKPGVPVRLALILVVGNDTDALVAQARAHAGAFDAAVAAAEAQWEQWWQGAFQRGMSFPGQLPVLTTDNAALAQTYYMGCLSLLCNAHTGELTNGHVFFPSAGPVYADAAMYIWDTTLNSFLYTSVAPASFELAFASWFNMDVHEHYAFDYLTFTGVGPWYAFNDLQIFRGLSALVKFLGPSALNTTLAGRTVKEWLGSTATYWMELGSSSANSTAAAKAAPKLEAAPCNLSGMYRGYWRGGKSPEYSSGITVLVASSNGTITGTYSGSGWTTGRGQYDDTSNSIYFAVFDSAGHMHANLTGSVDSTCTSISWDNNSTWCMKFTGACPGVHDDLLADYGNANNLLECVPTYIHKVPSLNAANAWMMREYADLLEQSGSSEAESAAASHLRELAANVSAAVRSRLYVNGTGFWACEMTDGSLVQVRHVVDFITIGSTLAADLTPAQRAEMTAFVQNELFTPNWMRALSLKDAAAPHSDRKDHGPFGAYDGWLGETVEALCRLGEYPAALNLTERMAAVYAAHGVGGQSHQVFSLDGAKYSGIAAKAHADQQYFATSGAVIANRIVTGLFGVDPPLGSVPSSPQGFLRDASIPRGFSGALSGVSIHGQLYTITSSPSGLTIAPE